MEAVQNFTDHGLRVYYIPRDRKTSLHNGRAGKPFTGDFSTDLLLDLFLLGSADVAVGLSTSNWCRLIDEIRLALGHGAQLLPYIDPLGVPALEF